MPNSSQSVATALLAAAVLFAVAAAPGSARGYDGKPACRVPLLDDDAAWERLPAVEETSSRRLPHWARALDVIWWTCRCHFMTRVADGFQLPLERDNVFQPKKPEPKEDSDAKPK